MSFVNRGAAVLVGLCAALTAAQPERPGAKRDDLAIIVNPRNPSRQLSDSEVSDIFLARRQFWGGQVRIIIVLEKNEVPAHQALLDRALSLSSGAQLAKVYSERRYRGTLAAEVRIVDSPAEVKAIVAREVNAIGYLWTSELDPSVQKVHDYPAP